MKNELSLRYHDKIHQPRQFRNKKISDKFKNIFLDMLENKNIDISSLPIADQKFIQEFYKASMKKDIKIYGGTNLDDIKKLTDKFYILKAEIQDFGNDNPEIKNQLSLIINELVKKGILPVEKAIEYSKLFIANV